MSGKRTIRERLLAAGLGLLALLLLLEIGLRLAGSGFDQPAAEIPDPQLDGLGDRVVLAVGDSMTWGIGASHGMSWPEQLERRLDQACAPSDFTVINGGLAGANSTMILDRLEAYLPVFEPDIVVILAGGSNKINYHGYHAWHGERSPLAHLDDQLFDLRIYRLLRYWGRTGIAPAVGGQDPVLDGVSGAITAYARWMSAQGNEPLEAFHTGGFLLEVGRYDQALETFHTAAQDHPHDASLIWGQAAAHKGLRDRASAEREYQRCLEQEPNNPACPFGLGVLLLEGMPQHAQGLPELHQAEAWFQQGVDNQPEFAANHWGLGMIHQRANRPSMALDAYIRCAELSPDDTRCYPAMRTVAEMSSRTPDLRAFLERTAGISEVAADQREAMLESQDAEKLLAWVHHDIEAMIDAAEATGAGVILAGYPYHDDTNTIFATVARERGLHYADIHARFQVELTGGASRPELFIADDAHCTDRGYGLMAQVVHQALTSSALVPR